MFYLIVLLALACLCLLLCLQAALEPTRASFMLCLLTLIAGLTFTVGGFYCGWNRNCRLIISRHSSPCSYLLLSGHWLSSATCDFRITPPDLHWKTNKHCFCWRSKQIIVFPLSLPVWPACHSIWCTLFVSYIFIGNLCAVLWIQRLCLKWNYSLYPQSQFDDILLVGSDSSQKQASFLW